MSNELHQSQVDQQKVDMATMEAYGYTDEQIAAEVEKVAQKVNLSSGMSVAAAALLLFLLL